MICSNKNSKQWKDLVSKVGETKALQIWQYLEGGKSIPENQEVRDFLEEKVFSDPDYYRYTYSGYLTPLVGTDPTPRQMAGAFFARLVDKVGKIEGDVLVTSNGNYTLFPTASQEYNSVTSTAPKLEQALNSLQRRFNIPFKVIHDPEAKWKGKYVNDGTRKLVVINTAYATMDTPLHEYYHPFVRLLMLRNRPLLDELFNEAQLKGDTRLDEEEVVTTYLAKAALERQKPSLFKAFISFLQRLFRNSNINESSTLKSILDTLEGDVDVSSENTLMEAFDKIEGLTHTIARKLNSKHGEHPHILEKLVQQAVRYTTSDASNFYQDESGKDTAVRLTAFIGDRELGEFSTYGKNFKWTQAEAVARQQWARLTKTPIDDKVPSSALTESVTVEGVEITFQRLLSIITTELDTARIKGKMIHSFLQFAFEEDPVKKEQARLQAVDYAKQYGKPFVRLEDHEDLMKIWRNIEQIAFDTNLALNVGDNRKYSAKLKDKMVPEVTLVSDLITDSKGNKIGTTADGLVEHFNGDLSILDWKTGDITKNRDTPYLIKYGSKFGLTDSKLTRGYLELAFRALIIKEKFPEATFREIKIVKIDKDGKAHNMRLELSPYLATISEYYKENNPELHKTLTERGLLDASNYEGVSNSLLDVNDQIAHLPHEERLIYLKNKLASLHHGKSKEQIERDPDIKALSNRYTKAILELEKVPGVNLEESTSDIPYIIGRFKNLSDISNPKVQTFHKILLKAKDKVAKESKEYEDKHDELLRNLFNEQKKRSSRVADTALLIGTVAAVGTASPLLFGASLIARAVIKRQLNTKTRDYWAFMWRKGTDGAYMNMLDTYNLKGVETALTPAQKAYRDFVRSSMEEKYSEFANELVGDDKYSRPISRANLLKMPSTLPATFMPRIPKEFDEVREEENFLQGGAGIGSAIKYQTRRYLTSFIEDSFDNPSTPIPFKFFQHEGSSVVQDELHSFDVEASYKAFMKNMTYKKHMDSVYDLALGVAQTLHDELDEDGRAKYPELSKFVNEVIYPQVLGTSRDVELQSKKWQTTAGPFMQMFTGIKEGTPIVVSQQRVMRIFKSSVTMMTLGFRVIGPIRNFAMIGVTVLSQSTKRLINRQLSSIIGVPPESFDGVDVTGATEVMRDYVKNKMMGNEENSKLWNIARKFNWLPDDFAYAVNKEHLLSKPLEVTPMSHAYMFYQVGETVGAMWHLAGLLKGMKVQNAAGETISVWDAYDNKGNWKAGVRGTVEAADGTTKELTELDELEIKNLKRANERLNGSYRLEERTAIENTIYGEFLFQFKKYFYQFLKVNFGSEYKDITTGKYVLDNKAPDGVPKYKWISEALEGRMMVLAKSILLLATFRGKEFKKYLADSTVSSVGTASNPRVRALSEGLNTAIWLLILLGVFSAAFDDDEEKKGLGKQALRLIFDTSRGLHPKDIFDTAKTPIVGAQRLSDLGNAAVSFISEGLIGGKENEEGYLIGSKTLIRALPFGGASIQMREMFKDYNIENDPILDSMK